MFARRVGAWALLLAVLLAASGKSSCAQQAAIAEPATSRDFPADLVNWAPLPGNPVFQGAAPGAWDAKIRERGWIMREGNTYSLWYTGYDGTRDGIKQLGYATSPDGLHWTRWPDNPLVRNHWVEDMMVVKQGETYYMFAEGLNDEAQLLVSKNHVNWEQRGRLNIRTHAGEPLSPGPFGTPTAWFENGTWYLFYERADAGVWLATSDDLSVFTNVQDAPVLLPGPEKYDRNMIAVNQIIKRGNDYFAFYHGSGDEKPPRTWSTCLARSTDRIHWQKYPGNPIVGPDHSSGVFFEGGGITRLYTMHNQVEVFVPAARPATR
jgi:sucrose-6-phosphate hydrolase SacC (GH32 family)